MTLGQHEKAMASAAAALQLDPKDNFANQNLAAAYLRMNRYDEAKAVVDKAKAAGLNQPIGDIVLMQIAFIRGDQAAIDKLMHDYAGTGLESTILAISAAGESFLGRVKASRAAFARAIQAAQQSGQKELAAELYVEMASTAMEMGFDPAQAKPGIAQGLAASDDPGTRATAAKAWALAGEIGRSEQLLQQLAQQYPKDLILNQGTIPVARALQALHKNQPAEAVRLLQSASPYEFGSFPDGLGFSAMYLRGKAYLMAHDGAKAAVEFQKVLDHRGIDTVSPLYPLSRLGLGRALAMQGDAAKARIAYQDFFDMWKDADPDIPALRQAKAEYARLQ
jgi:tetratricopeptide (TPR) repeat protein